jgi:meiotically up-regulated gene 157 (Mug157) protein
MHSKSTNTLLCLLFLSFSFVERLERALAVKPIVYFCYEKEQRRAWTIISFISGPYTYQRQGEPPDLRGRLAEPNGLIHSFFRPSDDLQKLPYLIPSQFFAHQTLKLLSELVDKLKWTTDFNDDIVRLTTDLRNVLFNENAANDPNTTITFNHTKHGLIYAYEIDGLGNINLMDDSNIPSLLSLPYLCPDGIPVNHTIYQNTRKFIFSPDNPWFFRGKHLEGKHLHLPRIFYIWNAVGVGGPHVGQSMVWPLAITMRGLTTNDEEEIRTCLKLLQVSHAGKGFMHEAANVDMPSRYTRSWFAWANSLFGEFIWKLYRERPDLLNWIQWFWWCYWHIERVTLTGKIFIF